MAAAVQPASDAADPTAEAPAESTAQRLRTDQQGDHAQRAVVTDGQFEVVDLAHALAVAVLDLPVQQMESDEDGQPKRSGAR
jgi:hypothetical protein